MLGCALVLGGGSLSAMAAQIERDLPGDWTLVENFRAVDDPANRRDFTITRVVLAPSKWADGQFDLQFEGEVSPTRGYFSLKLGRIWIKTQRRVDGRMTTVEYTGALKVGDAIVWEGLASTDGRKLSWGFEATRLTANH